MWIRELLNKPSFPPIFSPFFSNNAKNQKPQSAQNKPAPKPAPTPAPPPAPCIFYHFLQIRVHLFKIVFLISFSEETNIIEKRVRGNRGFNTTCRGIQNSCKSASPR